MAQPPHDKEVSAEPELTTAAPRYIGTERAEKMSGGGGGGGGDFGILESRVANLELRMLNVDTKLDTIIERLTKIPERSEIRQSLLVAIGLFVASMALFIGGMGWLETRAARVQDAVAASTPAALQPIVLQVPLPAQQKPNPPK
jgi:hypothetical protein